MDFVARLKRLRAAMQRADLDCLVYGTGANLQYFCGLPMPWQRENEPASPDCLLVLGQGETTRLVISAKSKNLATNVPVAVTVATSRDEIFGALRDSLQGKRIGVSERAECYLRDLISVLLPEAVCLNAETLGEELRYQKDADEIDLLRKAAALTDQVMGQVVGHIQPGVTQLDLQALIEQFGRRLGAEDLSFKPSASFVKSGTYPTADPFVYPKQDPLVPATSISFDFGFVMNGYCSDFGRSFYCGPAPDHIRGAYQALQAAQCYLVGQMKPGQRIGDLFGVLEAHLDQAGYGDRLRARLPDGTVGHQIGVAIHEDPWLKKPCNLLLQPGMVMAIEPKLLLSGEYYLRVEDIVLITDNGAEFLTGFNRELFELPL